jgi:50S ribosomal subunit-associated GTPase HflX
LHHARTVECATLSRSAACDEVSSVFAMRESLARRFYFGKGKI